ncbi:MAG: C_GCAxxG_C_C family protein [Anaerolineaceae bacterium]|nr:C_GCAxxG_C_C family protein [Anaerolineaceae bacterium]
MTTTGENARQHFLSGYKCAESVLLAVAEQQGIESDLIPSIASGFCSGMARTGGLCGAVAGGVLGLGLACGRQKADQPVDKLYQVEKIFLNQFTEKYGSTCCAALVHSDFNTPEGQAHFNENQLILKCHQMVEDATNMVVDLIEIE